MTLSEQKSEGGQVSTILILLLCSRGSTTSILSVHLGRNWCYLTTFTNPLGRGGSYYLEILLDDKCNKSFYCVVITIPFLLISEL